MSFNHSHKNIICALTKVEFWFLLKVNWCCLVQAYLAVLWCWCSTSWLISSWRRTAGLLLNPNKTKLMIFSWKRTSTKWTSTSSPMLSQLSCLATTFPSVTVMSDLKWNTHISNTCAKARQLLGFCTVFSYGWFSLLVPPLQMSGITYPWLLQCSLGPHCSNP